MFYKLIHTREESGVVRRSANRHAAISKHIAQDAGRLRNAQVVNNNIADTGFSHALCDSLRHELRIAIH